MKKIKKHFRTTLTIAILILAISAITMMETAVTASNMNGGGADNLSPTVCVAKPPNLVSWYKAENNALDSADGNNGTIQGNVTFTPGEVGQTFTLGGNGDLAGNGDRVLVGNPANLQLQNFTIEAWIKRSSSTIVTNSPVAGFAGGTFFAYGLNGYGFTIDQPTNRLGLTQIGVSAVFSTATITDTNFHHVAVTKSGNQVTFYVDGVADAPVTYNANFTFTTNAAIGARGDNDARNAFFGSEDELSIYNRALSLAEIQGIFNAGPAGKCDPPASTSFMVTNTNDSGAGSLRQAVMNSNISAGADTIEFDSSFNTAQTITLASQIIIDANDNTALTITGPGANLLTISGNNAVRIFNIAPSETVTFSNMKLTQGNADNSAGSAGDFFGGAILAGTGTTNVTNLIIDNNKARFGGGIYNFGTLNITDSTISNNTAATTNSNGGGIQNVGVALSITNSTISGNTADFGGGMLDRNSTTSITNSVFSNNSSTNQGGGIHHDGNGSLTITNTTVSGNTTVREGGGMFSASPPITITDSTFSNNSVTGSSPIGGGGIGFFLQTATITNSTFSGNTSTGEGGGIRNASGTLTFTNSTIVNNSTNASGGGIVGGATLRNSLIANNSASGTGNDLSGTYNSQGYNLIRNTTGATITGTTTGNITGVDPQIDPILRNNNTANRTKTHALRLTSPAINAGDPANPQANDQRNKPRVGISDIGAYERQPTDYIPLALFEFDGDGRSDVSVFRSTNSGATGTWYINRSTGGFTGVQFGAGTDLIAPSDYDGDGKTDIAVFRPSNGTWYYLKSSDGTFFGVQFGQSGDKPVPADYDGDDKADIAVFRPSNGQWYRLNSSNNQFVGGIAFGQAGDIPVPGDYNGNGKADLAIFRPSNGFWVIAKPVGVPARDFDVIRFGFGTDIPTPFDFDGDDKIDIAVFRPSDGYWYRLNSSDGKFSAFRFGQNGDIPVTADYDRDGKADYAVFRNGVWYYRRSSDGGFVAVTFGAASDKPVPAAF